MKGSKRWQFWEDKILKMESTLTFVSTGDIMETKKGDNVSAMKEKITKASIESLKKEGLRFSVDVLAEKLKISKKTIYKYFPTKEALARAIYERYYDKMEEEINKISSNDSIEKLLWLYCDSQTMIADAIFNKYKLNDVIRTYAVERHYSIWEKISSWSNSDKTESELAALKIIIDGSLKELSDSQINPQFVIEKLVKIL